jgi:hypothetical protein
MKYKIEKNLLYATNFYPTKMWTKNSEFYDKKLKEIYFSLFLFIYFNLF